MQPQIVERSSRLGIVFLAGCFALTACITTRGRSSASEPLIPHFDLESLTRDSTHLRRSALVGTVEDSSSGRPLGGAQVLLTSQPPGKNYYSYTDDFGGFAVKAVAPGSYDIMIRKVGYYPLTATHVFRLGFADTLRARLRGASMLMAHPRYLDLTDPLPRPYRVWPSHQIAVEQMR